MQLVLVTCAAFLKKPILTGDALAMGHDAGDGAHRSTQGRRKNIWRRGADSSANSHIDYRPHQDMYSAMGCRVQRYCVQVMIDAAREYARSQSRNDIYDVMFRTTIPAGRPTCFFVIEKASPGNAAGTLGAVHRGTREEEPADCAGRTTKQRLIFLLLQVVREPAPVIRLHRDVAA